MWECISARVTFLADLSAVITAVVAVWVWLKLVWSARKRRRALEEYLQAERSNPKADQGMRSILHLMSNLSMTEEQIYSAAFSSKVVSAVPITSESSQFASKILFAYIPPKRNRFKSK